MAFNTLCTLNLKTGKPEGNSPFERPERRWNTILKLVLKE
jgi:hypothetical protein